MTPTASWRLVTTASTAAVGRLGQLTIQDKIDVDLRQVTTECRYGMVKTSDF